MGGGAGDAAESAVDVVVDRTCARRARSAVGGGAGDRAESAVDVVVDVVDGGPESESYSGCGAAFFGDGGACGCVRCVFCSAKYSATSESRVGAGSGLVGAESAAALDLDEQRRKTCAVMFGAGGGGTLGCGAVSYTHLTLPTKRIV